jgi:hypothetical protein
MGVWLSATKPEADLYEAWACADCPTGNMVCSPAIFPTNGKS